MTRKGNIVVLLSGIVLMCASCSVSARLKKADRTYDNGEYLQKNTIAHLGQKTEKTQSRSLFQTG